MIAAYVLDAVFGDANRAGEDNRNVARMTVLLAGVPTSVPRSTINRLASTEKLAGIHLEG